MLGKNHTHCGQKQHDIPCTTTSRRRGPRATRTLTTHKPHYASQRPALMHACPHRRAPRFALTAHAHIHSRSGHFGFLRASRWHTRSRCTTLTRTRVPRGRRTHCRSAAAHRASLAAAREQSGARVIFGAKKSRRFGGTRDDCKMIAHFLAFLNLCLHALHICSLVRVNLC